MQDDLPVVLGILGGIASDRTRIENNRKYLSELIQSLQADLLIRTGLLYYLASTLERIHKSALY
jgi:hypothetical protein